jgi:hypothetical protein
MKHALILFAAIPLVACTSLDSDDIETSGIHAFIRLSSTEGSTDTFVSVTMHAGNNPTQFINLVGDDKLTASAGEETIDLDESNLLGAYSYNGNLSTQEPGTEVTVALERVEKASAPSSKVALTEKLALTAPAASSTFSRADDDIDVQWNSAASPDAVTVSWSGSCVQDGSRDVAADATQVLIEKGSIQKKPDPEQGDPVPDTCDVTLKISRSRTGTLDPAWGGGEITHTYSDSLTFTSNL